MLECSRRSSLLGTLPFVHSNWTWSRRSRRSVTYLAARTHHKPPNTTTTTSFLTTTTLVYAPGAGITAAAGTRLALQWILAERLKLRSFRFPRRRTPRDRYFMSLSPRVGIGQFARLLPSLEVVAISQAPSPESNPNSPLPVNATVVHDTTVES